jgi:hypothetical protein
MVAYWLADGNFTCPVREPLSLLTRTYQFDLKPTDFGGLYERSTIGDILKNAFFLKYTSNGVVHRDLYKTITVPTIAAVAAAVCTSL